VSVKPLLAYFGANRNVSVYPLLEYFGAHRNVSVYPLLEYFGANRNVSVYPLVCEVHSYADEKYGLKHVRRSVTNCYKYVHIRGIFVSSVIV